MFAADNNLYLQAVLQQLSKKPPKPKVFISYHHDNDQWDYDRFSELFSNSYDILYDSSVDRNIRSDDAEYQMRRIREEYITGTSITIVLCGKETYKRKFVDWEICTTLNKEHALLGINLPDNPMTNNGKYVVPARLHDNIQSGFAGWMQWSNDPKVVAQVIDSAREKAKNTSLIHNSRQTMKRNQS